MKPKTIIVITICLLLVIAGLIWQMTVDRAKHQAEMKTTDEQITLTMEECQEVSPLLIKIPSREELEDFNNKYYELKRSNKELKELLLKN
jgi:inner membrane protein involved in colicin E2 resistance